MCKSAITSFPHSASTHQHSMPTTAEQSSVNDVNGNISGDNNNMEEHLESSESNTSIASNASAVTPFFSPQVLTILETMREVRIPLEETPAL